jgi:hypothetical protein
MMNINSAPETLDSLIRLPALQQGHGFSRADSRDFERVMYGLKPVPFTEPEFFRSL